MNGPGGSDYDVSSDEGDYKSSIEGIASARKKNATIGLADPRGVLGIHFKELRLLPWNQESLFDEENINVYCRAIVVDKVKWTCVLDGASFPATYILDDIKHIPVELNVNNLEDVRNRMLIELVGYDRPDMHYVIARKHIHIFSVVKHMYARDTLHMKRKDEIVAEVDIDFCFSYGVFGYGYSNQLESKELTPTDYLNRSMFCRLEPPLNRCEDLSKDVIDAKFIGHPAYIPFTCMAKNLADPDIAFGPGADSQPEVIAEPTMVITRLRERLNYNLKEYEKNSTRKERIRWLKQFIFNSQLTDPSKEEIVIPVGSVFRRKQGHRRTTFTNEDPLFKRATERIVDEGTDAKAAEEQHPAGVPIIERIKAWFGFGAAREYVSETQIEHPEIPIATPSSSQIVGRRLSHMLVNEDKNIRFIGTKVKIEIDNFWRRLLRQVRSWASHILRWHTATQVEVEMQMCDSEREILNTIRRHTLHSVRERSGSVLTQCDDPLLGLRRSSRPSEGIMSVQIAGEHGSHEGPSGKKLGHVRSEVSRRGSKIPSMDALSEDEEIADYDDMELSKASETGHIPLRDTAKDDKLSKMMKVVAEVNAMTDDEAVGPESDGRIVTDGRKFAQPCEATVINVQEAEVLRDTISFSAKSRYSLYDESVWQETDVARPIRGIRSSDDARTAEDKSSDLSLKSDWLSLCELESTPEMPSTSSEMVQVEPDQQTLNQEPTEDFVDYVVNLSTKRSHVKEEDGEKKY